MTLSNITDRGTLRGTIYRGAGTGTTDYTMLSNKPQINGHTLQGNQTGDDLDLIDKGSLQINGHTLQGDQSGDDLGLINNDDLSFNIGYAGNILHNIKYKNDTYNVYAAPFSGASSGNNGKIGLVPAPLGTDAHDDYNKFLKGNGLWAKVLSKTLLYENPTNASQTPIILNSNISNYNFILIISKTYADSIYYDSQNFYDTSEIGVGWGTTTFRFPHNTDYCNIHYSNDNTLIIPSQNHTFVKKIYGIKL